MKKLPLIVLLPVLTLTLFTACRNNNAATGTSTTKRPATSAATQTTLLPSPDITLPIGTTSTGTPDTTATRPAARGPRY